MKANFHFHFYSRIIVAIAILAMGIFFLQRSVNTTALVVSSIEVGGFAYSDVIGWISLNCNNDFNGDGLLQNLCGVSNYKVNVDAGANNALSGCAWAGQSVNSDSDNVAGWICFSDPGGSGTNPPVGVFTAPSNLENALYSSLNDFASIVKFEEFFPPPSDRFKLGFPIIDQILPAPSPISGCFNCYEKQIKNCAIDGLDCTSSACDLTNPANVCQVTGLEQNCENCLEYSFYGADQRSDGYAYSREITIDPTSTKVVGGPHVNFPLLISISDNSLRQISFAGGRVYSTTGDDIKFTSDAAGTIKLAHEIEEYNFDEGTLVAWVKMPSLNSLDKIYIFYGKDNIAAPEEDIVATWAGTNYAGILHLDDYTKGTNAVLNDSADPSHTYTAFNMSGPSASVAGKIGGATRFDGQNLIAGQRGDWLELNSTIGTIVPQGTISAWIYVEPDDTFVSKPIEAKDFYTWFSAGNNPLPSFFDVQFAQGSDYEVSPAVGPIFANESFIVWEEPLVGGDPPKLWAGAPLNSPIENNWHHVTFSMDSTSGNTFYIDGQLTAAIYEEGASPQTQFFLNIAGADGKYYVGTSPETSTVFNHKEFFTGIIDEIQISSSVRSAGWITTMYNNQNNPSTFYSLGAETNYNKAGDISQTTGGFVCSNCTVSDYGNTCDLNVYGDNPNSCQTCALAYDVPGVMVDHQYGQVSAPNQALLCGWGYNSEIGWVQFSGKITTSTRPYWQAEGGDVFSRGSIVSQYAPPFGNYNASYIIETGGTIRNFFSNSSFTGVFQGELRNRQNPLQFLNSNANATKFSNALAQIDAEGLVTKLSDGNNKYGSQVLKWPDDFTLPTFANQLADEKAWEGKVYYVPNASPITITTGASCAPSYIDIENERDKLSSGIIFIDGDLEVNSNIRYKETVSIQNLMEIPSLVWIIKGDLLVNNSVSELAGTFIILGDGATACPGAGCGRFVTDNDLGCNQTNQLIVTGSIFARQFDLGREYFDASRQAAEIFRNDGRLHANPPKGLLDFAEIVPRFNSQP